MLYLVFIFVIIDALKTILFLGEKIKLCLCFVHFSSDLSGCEFHEIFRREDVYILKAKNAFVKSLHVVHYLQSCY